MMKIVIYDIIGIKSGMNYYLKSFKELLNENNISASIRSNYATNGKTFFYNIFNGSKFFRIIKLFLNLIKFRFSLLRSTHVSVWLFYGSYIDVLFFLCCFRNKQVIIDVHETIIQGNTNPFLKMVFSILYKYSNNNIIYHSEKIRASILSFNFNNRFIFVPHFKYSIDKNINLNNVKDDVLNAVDKQSISYLFFGHIRESKGIMELLNGIEYLNNEKLSSKVSFVVAGQDSGNLIENKKYKHIEYLTIVNRRINNDELIYLFNHCNYILLPYKSISQSGVLEMAIYFEKNIITSKLDYFEQILRKYKSFGFSYNPEDVNDFVKIIKQSLDSKSNYIKDVDLKNYNNKSDYLTFIKELNCLIENKI